MKMWILRKENGGKIPIVRHSGRGGEGEVRKVEGGDGGYFGVQKSVEEEKTITVTGLFSYSITMSNWGMQCYINFD